MVHILDIFESKKGKKGDRSRALCKAVGDRLWRLE